MKKFFYAILGMFLALNACHPTHVIVQNEQPAPTPVQQEVSYQNFYDELSPYGHWIDYPGYGYVWMPVVGPGFKPYATNGYWIYTDMGWTWASNYSWGWAPFHYGRWFYEGAYGWMWMPGNEWSPAWVSWRRSNDYYGWAPLGPNVGLDVYGGSYNPPSNYWCFVPHQYISSPRVNNYYVNESRNVTIINNTTIINTRVVNVTNNNNTRINNNARNVYMNGPDRQEVERVTGSPIRPAIIRENNRPGEQLNNGQYNIYRPRVNAVSTQGASNQSGRIAPARVESLRDVRPMPSYAGNMNGQGNNSQPVIRNSNNAAAPPNSIRTADNLPATDGRPRQVIDNNQPANDRFNNRNNASTGNQPLNRNNINSPSAPVNNNQPSDTRFNRNNNAQVNSNNAAVGENPHVNARPAVINSRPVNGNDMRVNSPTNKPAPANSAIRNNTNPGQNNNSNADRLNQLRRPSASSNSVRPVDKKEKKDE